jgi:DNA-binding response OmpR family regulator
MKPKVARLANILYVEDHEGAQSLVKSLLEATGHNIVAAASASNGIALAKSSHFDLYLIDTLLPDKTGVDLCRHIRAFDVNAPILFLSAQPQSAKAAIAAGAQAFVLKPAKPEELEDEIDRLLEESAAAKAKAAALK